MRRRHLSNKMEGAATPPQIKSQVVLIEITLNLRLCKDSESLNNLVNYLSYLIKNQEHYEIF